MTPEIFTPEYKAAKAKALDAAINAVNRSGLSHDRKATLIADLGVSMTASFIISSRAQASAAKKINGYLQALLRENGVECEITVEIPVSPRPEAAGTR